ncbi:spermatogenesis associated 6-like protein isoform X1 [Photinus pyralis]|uniref:Spermatogenesis-associated protein 6 N-terminal domain-containing protein n=2 Tax=Photinus pyralis TaxID=7054 RepID=A0A1Y1LI13_PHOPY|nr:spermatogenesis associated 6-like protein isoform X1 [Photinus pyralis]XP_031352297.1 spermatogenesis associated 6-like protein isoform X1 [Photinus pyralis]XP_031352340.1 spermatogenesis associated 6-like protein isoform X1 [Photinus pyralis]XP_031352341.1 spermatogenesis associated 6-like protein isoform X1 [Photinus pyralis]
MPRKALRVQIELDIQAVTCPGVWLCPNGKVSLQIYMLDSCIQTTALPPVFPLLYHEQFIFYKTFHTAHTLVELQRVIDKDFLYAELLQWQKGNTGNVIASFQTSLHEVLYPSSTEGTLSGVDVDLLMEPSKIFPGIIAPKIEISTRATVEQIVCSNDRAKSSHYVVNPKTIPSNYIPRDLKRNNKLPRQKRVCHSVEYHRSRKCVPNRPQFEAKPPFVFKKPEDELLSRKPQGINGNYATKFFQVKKLELSPRSRSRDVPSSNQEQKCSCGSIEECHVCAKYSSYFDGGAMVNDHYTTADAFVRKVCSDPASGSTDNAIRCKRSPNTPEQYGTPPLCSNKYCVRCTLKRRPSVAKQIHDRLVRTLDFCSPVNNCDEERDPASCTITACCSPKSRNCDQGFYENYELYRC